MERGSALKRHSYSFPAPDYSNPLASGSSPISELVRDGVYTEVEETEQYINVSRKVAIPAELDGSAGAALW